MVTPATDDVPHSRPGRARSTNRDNKLGELTMHHFRLAVLMVAVTLAVAACSGSYTPAPSAPPSVAKSATTSLATASAAVPVAPSAAASAATGDVVSIANFSFQPATITISVGTTVTWTNTDSAGHTVTADGGSFKSDKLGTGATFSQTFATAGTFAYHCSIHPSMKGTVTVH
jgi:plastocyanin